MLHITPRNKKEELETTNHKDNILVDVEKVI